MDEGPYADQHGNRVLWCYVDCTKLTERFLEIHVHHDPEIIIDGHDAIQDADDGKPVILGLDGCAEDVKLAGKSRERRYACEREKKDAHAERDERMTRAETRVTVDIGVLLAFSTERDNCRESPDVHESVDEKIEKYA